MLRFTKTTLKKVEEICREIGYTVRYEKGQFQPGYCLLETKRVIVVNKFLSTEARVNSLLDLIDTLDLDHESLSENSRSFYNKYIIKRLEQV